MWIVIPPIDQNGIIKAEYLSKGKIHITPTHGRLFQDFEDLVDQQSDIDDTAPETGYLGFDEGEGNADDFWTWGTTNQIVAANVVFPMRVNYCK